MNILCFQVCFSASQTYQNLFIFEKRGVYIMQKLDCRIPNWITFLELMSYFPRLSRDLQKIFPTTQRSTISFFNTQTVVWHNSKPRYGKDETHTFWNSIRIMLLCQILNGFRSHCRFWDKAYATSLGWFVKIFFWCSCWMIHNAVAYEEELGDFRGAAFAKVPREQHKGINFGAFCVTITGGYPRLPCHVFLLYVGQSTTQYLGCVSLNQNNKL